MEIRAYERGDLDALLRLFYDTVHAVNLGDYTQAQVDAWADGCPDRAAWERSLSEHVSLVALAGEKIVGFGDIDASGYLDRLYVHKDFQHRGVATALCDRLEAHARGKTVTAHASITALPFFLRRGYRLVRPQTVFRKGVALNNFLVEKPSFTFHWIAGHAASGAHGGAARSGLRRHCALQGAASGAECSRRRALYRADELWLGSGG